MAETRKKDIAMTSNDDFRITNTSISRVAQASICIRCGNDGVSPRIRGYYANDGDIPPKVRQPARN